MKQDFSLSEAAVLLVLLRDGPKEKILLTRRSLGLREHSGEVAFPGGKHDDEDSSLYRTALREGFEEVGLTERMVVYRAELDAHYTRKGARVAAFVVDVRKQPDLVLCEAEIESSKWVPVSIFQQDLRCKTHIFRHMGQEYWAPVYRYEDYEIWGFTARVMVSFVNKFYGGQVARAHDTACEEYFN